MRRLLLALLALIASLAPALAQTGPPKPKVPSGRHPGGVVVAVIGAGVDYRLPEIAARLARDGEGEIIAWDVIDDDPRPLETPPIAGRRVPPHAGTAVTEIVLSEAGATSLVPVRIPDANPMALGGALAFVARTPARVALLLPGAAKDEPLALFTDIARQARHLVLIAPAGHFGGDGVSVPGLANLILVTATDAQGRILPGVTTGANRVDVAVPVPADVAAGREAQDAAALAEAVAAARLAALAARLVAVEPGLDGAALKARMLSYAKPLPSAAESRTRAGWIADVKRIHWLE